METLLIDTSTIVVCLLLFLDCQLRFVGRKAIHCANTDSKLTFKQAPTYVHSYVLV